MNLKQELESLLSEKNSLTGKLGDISKIKKNSIINDLPSIDTVKNQSLISPKTATSTHGLNGFEGDKKDVKSSILLGQNQDEDSYINLIKDQTFGHIQVEFQEDGGTQTKSVEVPHNLVGNISQEEIAKSSSKDKLRFEEIIKKFTLKDGTKPIHQLNPNDLIKVPQGAIAKTDMLKQTGLRNAIENINRVIQGKLEGVKAGIPKKDVTAQTQKVETSSLEALQNTDVN